MLFKIETNLKNVFYHYKKENINIVTIIFKFCDIIYHV